MVANLPVEEWHRVHQQLRGIARRRAALDAEEARWLRDAERVQLWRRLGYVHMGEYLERELGHSPHAGAERLRVARALAELPQIEAALDNGVVHYTAVRELSRVATAETEAEWLASARGRSLRQVEVMVAGHKRGDRPSTPAAPELMNRIVRLELAPDVFALLRQAQASLADEHGGRLDDNAFIQLLCRRALEASGPADHARPAHQISITVCDVCKRGWQNGAGREIDVGRDVIERAQCDAELIGSLDQEQPARVTATVTPRIRRQVLARDRHGCTVPGCRSARNLDLHHIEYQSEGGSHEIWNLTTLCSGHHQRIHEGALVLRGRAPDDLEFIWREPAAPSGSPHGGPERAAQVPRSTAGVAPAPSHDAPAATAPRIAAAVTPATSHEGSTTTAPRIAAAAAPMPSHGGSTTTDPRMPAAVAPATSHGGPTTTTPRIPAAVVPAASHGRPANAAHAPPSTASVEPGPSHGRPTHVRRTATSAGRWPVTRHPRTPRSAAAAVDNEVARDVRDALTTAGYKPHEAHRAVEHARAHVRPGASLEQVLREALRCCARIGDRSQDAAK